LTRGCHKFVDVGILENCRRRRVRVVNSQLHGSVSLRPLDITDAAQLAAAYTLNRDHLLPWEPIRPAVFYTVGGQEEVVGSCLSEQAKKRSYFWVLLDGPRIVGRISLNNVGGRCLLQR